MRTQKLMTKQLLKRFSEVGDQDIPDPLCIAKFFHPLSSITMFATSYDPKDRLFFGWVDGPYPELGYFSLVELEGTRVGGLPMERDAYFSEKRLSAIKKLLYP